MTDFDTTKLLTYEMPTITEFISYKPLQTIIARYLARKVNRKMRRYNKRKERALFLSQYAATNHV